MEMITPGEVVETIGLKMSPTEVENLAHTLNEASALIGIEIENLKKKNPNAGGIKTKGELFEKLQNYSLRLKQIHDQIEYKL